MRGKGPYLYDRERADWEWKNLLALLQKKKCFGIIMGMLHNFFPIYSRLLLVLECSTSYKIILGLSMDYKRFGPRKIGNK